MNTFLKKYFATIKRFLPEKTEMTSLGLDIGSQSCKWVEVRKKEQRFELIRWGIEPVIKKDISLALKAIFERMNISTKSLYCAISGKGTLIRFIEMPRLTLDELKSSFSLEAEKYFPFDLNQIYTDCCIVDSQPSQKKMAVLVAAAKKELIDRKIELLTRLGCQVDFVGFNILALANVIMNTDYQPEQLGSSLAVLGVEDEVSSLMITANRIPCFSRDIFVGATDIKKAFAANVGQSISEIESLLEQSALKSEEVVKACDLALENLVRELRMSFDYFSTEGNKEVKELMLFGEIANNELIVNAIEKNLEIKIIRWDPKGTITLAPDVSEEEFQKNANRLGVAVGLALNDYA